MPNEWVCEECGHSTLDDPGEEKCPCGGSMVNIGDTDDDTRKENDYPGEEFEPMDLAEEEIPLERMQGAADDEF
ncbi:MAG: hypothetical protein WC080_03975 [Patescibacteria group bacterium]|jgi:hypothetical protein